MTYFTQRRLAFLLAAILGSAAAGAQDDGPPAATPWTLDQEYARLAERVPGFGGLYLDERGTTHVYLLDPSLAREVQSLGERVEVHQGDYDFRDLLAWKSEVRALLALPGMISLDIDETRNRLVLAAEPAYVERLQRDLRELLRPTSVPAAAVVVEAGELAEPLANLQDKIRPIPSGVQIRNSGGGGCTLGVNVTRGGVRGFVTNSHCTGELGEVTGKIFFQSTVGPLTRVGVETVDPAFLASILCPDNRRCRYSDSAFVAYDDGDLSEGGNIAFPAYCLNASGTLEISGAVPRLPIAGAAVSNPPVGSVLYKVGRTTGCTFGTLMKTCTDHVVSKWVNDLLTPTDLTLLCQNRVGAGSDRGDSGSPVFRKIGLEAMVEGLLWGRNLGSGGFMYSPWSSVAIELGIPQQPDAP